MLSRTVSNISQFYFILKRKVLERPKAFVFAKILCAVWCIYVMLIVISCIYYGAPIPLFLGNPSGTSFIECMERHHIEIWDGDNVYGTDENLARLIQMNKCKLIIAQYCIDTKKLQQAETDYPDIVEECRSAGKWAEILYIYKWYLQINSLLAKFNTGSNYNNLGSPIRDCPSNRGS